MRSTFSRPIHTADNAAEGKSSRGIAAGRLFEYFQHPILIEAAVPKVRFSVDAELQLPAPLGGGRVDSYRSQPLQMVTALIRINDVHGLVATLESVLNERKQHAILFVVAIEKRADMTYFAERGAGKGNGCRGPLHGVFLPRFFREPGYVPYPGF